jgi:hypothetical protein
MIRTAVVAGMAIGVGLGGAAMAQSLRLPPIPQTARALLVDHDDDKHQHGKNKHREREDDGDDEDRGRGRRALVPGSWRDYPPPPTYYYSPQPFSYATPYVPYAPYERAVTAPSAVSPRPSARVGPPPAASGAASTEPNRRDGSGSTAPTIKWVDPPPAR